MKKRECKNYKKVRVNKANLRGLFCPSRAPTPKCIIGLYWDNAKPKQSWLEGTNVMCYGGQDGLVGKALDSQTERYWVRPSPRPQKALHMSERLIFFSMWEDKDLMIWWSLIYSQIESKIQVWYDLSSVFKPQVTSKREQISSFKSALRTCCVLTAIVHTTNWYSLRFLSFSAF
jgi:hypothetical protein